MADRSYSKNALNWNDFRSKKSGVNPPSSNEFGTNCFYGLCFPCHKKGGGEMSELKFRYDI